MNNIKWIFFYITISFLEPVMAQNSSISENSPTKKLSAYLFTYFTGNGKDAESIRFAISNDGYNYRALNNNLPVLNSVKISSTGGLRDPHIYRCVDGKTFFMVATDMCVEKNGWGANFAMVLLKSTDLVNWHSQIVNIPRSFPEFATANRVWAPQTIYDAQKGKYMIYWAMRLGNEPDKIYYAYANKDFTGLESTPKQLFFSPTNNACIDADIIKFKGKYHLFFKTEDQKPGIKKAVSEKLTDGYLMVIDQYLEQTSESVEGSGVFKLNNSDEWILMYDVYRNGKYQFTKSKDLENFSVIDNEISMNFHPRHGTIMPITAKEAETLNSKWLLPVDTMLSAQSNALKIENSDFEQSSIKPWVSLGSEIKLSTSVFHSGKQSLEITAGSTAQLRIELRPNSKYKIMAWLKTNSGSDEVQLNITGLGNNNVSIASALADWVKLGKTFITEEGQSSAFIEIYIPDNPNHSSAWVDDINIEYTGAYLPEKPNGIKPLTQRVPKSDLGITQQENSKFDWLLDAKFGMFIHWGIYSGPAKGEWFMENKGVLPEEYRKMAYPEGGDLYFDAAKFNADEWVSIAKAAGMKYMNMVTMHHDGYSLFESKYMDAFTSKQTHNRDFVKEYVDACRKQGMKVGLYKTLINWRYPGYYDITGTDCKPNKFGYKTDLAHKENARLMKEELYCQVKELMTNYGKIDQIYWDGGWLGQQGSDADGAYFWESGKFLDPKSQWPVNSYFQDLDEKTGKPLGIMGIVRKYQPDVIVNPRTGWYGDYKSEEGGQAISGPVRTEEVWEKNMTMAPGWGYTPAHSDTTQLITSRQLKRMLADCVIRNMSLLLNVGPDRHGQITKEARSVLMQTGMWLEKVGDAVYGTRGGPWNPKDGEYGYAYKGNTIYVYLLNGFHEKKFELPAVNKDQKVVRAFTVGDGKPVLAKQNKNKGTVLTGFQRIDKDVTIIAVELNRAVMPEK